MTTRKISMELTGLKESTSCNKTQENFSSSYSKLYHLVVYIEEICKMSSSVYPCNSNKDLLHNHSARGQLDEDHNKDA